MLAAGSRKKLEGISISKMMVSFARYRIKARFATKPVVFVVENFSNDVLKSDFSLSLSRYASSILSHRPKQFQRYNDGCYSNTMRKGEAIDRFSIPSDKNDCNYKKIHNSIYYNSRDTERIGLSCAVFFFFFFSSPRFSYNFRHDVKAKIKT